MQANGLASEADPSVRSSAHTADGLPPLAPKLKVDALAERREPCLQLVLEPDQLRQSDVAGIPPQYPLELVRCQATSKPTSPVLLRARDECGPQSLPETRRRSSKGNDFRFGLSVTRQGYRG
jgi:hypothetical protein